MASYGLLKGFGRGLEKVGDDIGERLKMERLQAYQDKVRGQEQEFTAGQNKMRIDAQVADNSADREFRANEAATEREFRGAENEKARQDNLRELALRLSASGTDATANERDVQAMVAAGFASDEAEAWSILKGDNPGMAEAIRVAGMMQEEQASAYVGPGDEGYMSVDQLIDAARQRISGQTRSRSSASSPATPQGAQGSQPSQAALDYLRQNSDNPDVLQQFRAKYNTDPSTYLNQ